MNELLLVFCYFFQFPTLGTGTVFLFTFGTSAAVFLERAIQFLYQLLLNPPLPLSLPCFPCYLFPFHTSTMACLLTFVASTG